MALSSDITGEVVGRGHGRSGLWWGLALMGALLALAVPAGGCKHSQPAVVLKNPDGTVREPPPKPAAGEEEAAQALAREAAALEAAGDVQGAETKRADILQRFAATGAAALIWEARAQNFAAAGRLQDAAAAYEALLYYRPSFERAAVARERYGSLLLDIGRAEDAVQVLRSLWSSLEGEGDRLRVGRRLHQALVAAEQAREALEVLVELRAQSDVAPAERAELEQLVLRTIASDLSFSDTEKLWNSVRDRSSWSLLHPALAFKLAKIYFHTRQFRRSEEMLKLVMSRFPSSPFAPQASALLAHLTARFEVDGQAVGVVLPLSGRFKEYGQRSLNAIRLAMGERSRVRLVVKDTEGDPAIAAKAVEDLVLQDHVVAIIGPLFSAPAMSAAQQAEQLNVPIITLSHQDGLPQVGPYVFRTALTVTAQAQALAKVAFEQLGMTRFAIIHPRSRYGLDFTQAFWDEVDKRQGEIRGIESYEPNETTFSEPVRRLVGKWYLQTRDDYRAALDTLREQNYSPQRQQHELGKLEKSLPPLVDFDGIIIPDSGKMVGLVAPALAFDDVVLTHDAKTIERIKKATGREDVRPVTLLGASTWINPPTLVDSCEQYCEGSVFVDAFYPDSTDPRVRDFVAAFREATGVIPQLVDAQAYDTAAMVKSLIELKTPADRDAMREALAAVVFDGVTGRFHFDTHGEVQKDLFVLTLKDRMIRPLEPLPARTPQG